ncbi:MAG: recombinase family protein [Ruthenibacterium sp.]
MIADILARYSTDNQNPSTIDVQVDACKEWCAKHGYEVGRVFADEAVSGMKDTRAGYEACVRHLSMGGADLVVVYDQSRMFREFTEWFDFRKLVSSFGAGVASVTQPQLGGDLKDPAVFISEAATAMMNHAQVLITRQKTVEALRFRANNAKTSGGRPALGYDTDKDKHYIINEAEAATVRLIYRLSADGHSYGEIVDELNRRGLTTKRGQPFGKNSLYEILRNEKYGGVLVYGATEKGGKGGWNAHSNPRPDAIRIEGGVPSIVDKATFDIVHEKMSKRRGCGGRYAAKQEYYLTGRVYCGRCGAAMVVHGSNGSMFQYYECGAKNRKHTCSMRNVRVDILDRAVATSVQAALTDKANRDAMIETVQQAQREAATVSDTAKAEAVARLKSINGKLENLTNAIMDGLYSEALKEKMLKLEDDKKAAQVRLAELQPPAPVLSAEEITALVDGVIYADISTPDGMRAALAVVTRVVVNDDTFDIDTFSEYHETNALITHSDGNAVGSPEKTTITSRYRGFILFRWTHRRTPFFVILLLVFWLQHCTEKRG